MQYISNQSYIRKTKNFIIFPRYTTNLLSINYYYFFKEKKKKIKTNNKSLYIVINA
jgi:hypothetical protein